MKRWEILIWILVTAVTAVAIFWVIQYYLRDNNNSVVDNTVNIGARLASSGSPLPAASPEDVVIEQQQFDNRVFTLSYDYDNSNWQLTFFQDGVWHNIRYIATDQTFFYYNPLDLIWDEVDIDLISDEIKQLIEVESVILSQTDLDLLSSNAIEEESDKCPQDASVACAVWYISATEDNQDILIYVNKRNRKIDQILTLNSIDNSQAPLIANYFYRSVDIQPPDPDQTRYLLEE